MAEVCSVMPEDVCRVSRVGERSADSEHLLDELGDNLNEGSLADMGAGFPVTADLLTEALPASLLEALAVTEEAAPTALVERLARNLPAVIDVFWLSGCVPGCRT
ncbi:hypothetical protein [Streptomyces sp. NPDC001774]